MLIPYEGGVALALDIQSFKNHLSRDNLRQAVLKTPEDSELESILDVAIESIISRLGNSDLDTKEKVVEKNSPLLNQAILIFATFQFENSSFYVSHDVGFLLDNTTTRKSFFPSTQVAVDEQIDNLISQSGLRKLNAWTGQEATHV